MGASLRRWIPILSCVVTIAGLEHLRRRQSRAHALLALLTPDLDPDMVYEACESCPPGGFCLHCFDVGYLTHICR